MTSIKMEMDGEHDARLAELTAGFAAVSGPVQGAVLALLAAAREAEMRQGEAIAGLVQEKAMLGLRIQAMSAENAGLHSTIAGIGRDNETLRAEREGILTANRALQAEREAFQDVERAMAAFSEARRTTDAALAASSPAPDVGQEPVVEDGSAICEATAVTTTMKKPGGVDAPTAADRLVGGVGTTDGTAMEAVDVVFKLPAALLGAVNRMVGIGHFASRDALTAAAIEALIAPDQGAAAAMAAAAGCGDPIRPRPEGGPSGAEKGCRRPAASRLRPLLCRRLKVSDLRRKRRGVTAGRLPS